MAGPSLVHQALWRDFVLQCWQHLLGFTLARTALELHATPKTVLSRDDRRPKNIDVLDVQEQNSSCYRINLDMSKSI